MIERNSDIREQLNKLRTPDVYSLLLFAVYKLKDIPEYLMLSELPYLLENKSLLNFLNYYGGKTITIPTLDDLNSILDALFLYQKVSFENKTLKEALKLLDVSYNEGKKLTNIYVKLCELLRDYDFSRDDSIGGE